MTLLALSEGNPQGYAILLRSSDTTADAELSELSGKILAIIDKGRFVRRADSKIIAEEIRRLSSTARGRLAAMKRLKNAGEYAVVYMLDAMSDGSRREELPNIVWALPRIGKDAIRPLVAGLQTEDIALKAEIIRALGKIGYSQSLAYLKYIVETDGSAELRQLASRGIRQTEPSALKIPAAELFYQLAEKYYYRTESLAPVEDADFANIWFWDVDGRSLIREKVDRRYFNELMAMRACEWALKADAGYGKAIGLWLASYFQAESTGLSMPKYFGEGHADAMMYATTSGPEYLHQTLARAIKDNNAYVALGAVEALTVTAGEKSLLYRVGPAQPLVEALSFDDKAVRYSAAIAIAASGPKKDFAESRLVVNSLVEAIEEAGGSSYTARAVKVMLQLAQSRNNVIGLSAAEDALIALTKGGQAELKVLSCMTLAYLNSPDAQRAIAAMALVEVNAIEIQIAAFNCLSVSAKLHSNLLDDDKVAAIYSLISSKEADAGLRSAGAAAFGSLNLPSQKVKELILDQSSS